MARYKKVRNFHMEPANNCFQLSYFFVPSIRTNNIYRNILNGQYCLFQPVTMRSRNRAVGRKLGLYAEVAK